MNKINIKFIKMDSVLLWGVKGNLEIVFEGEKLRQLTLLDVDIKRF